MLRSDALLYYLPISALNCSSSKILHVQRRHFGTLSSSTQFATRNRNIETKSQIQGNASVHNDLGNLLKSRLQLAEAKLCYLEALRIQPTLAVAWNNLACIFLDEGNTVEALQRFSQALVLDPSLARQAVRLFVDGIDGLAVSPWRRGTLDPFRPLR